MLMFKGWLGAPGQLILSGFVVTIVQYATIMGLLYGWPLGALAAALSLWVLIYVGVKYKRSVAALSRFAKMSIAGPQGVAGGTKVGAVKKFDDEETGARDDSPQAVTEAA